jgi:spermidine/putrescine transport system ATP-binding protein
MREQMQVELRGCSARSASPSCLVTHDQEEALIMSDRIAVMFEGNIAQLAGPQQLYRRPVSRTVAEFIGVMNFLPATVESAGERIAVEAAGLGRFEIDAEQCPGGARTGAASVGFRPETLTILFDGETPRARVSEGEVVEVTYYGDMTYYGVRLDGVVEPLTISMRNLFGRRVLDQGERARVSWDPGALVLFC